MQATLKIIALSIILSTVTPSFAEADQLVVDDCTVTLTWRNDFTPDQQDKVREWLVAVMQTMRLLNGALPRKEIRIELQATRGYGAVPFARVLRQEPEGVLFYINPDSPLTSFVSDWTAYHELSHLFIPYPGQADIWFSEGLASYYQNVLQARAGLLTPDAAREKLRAGFERGRNDNGNAELTLRELSAVMREKRAFMRVYWSGALYFLQADLQLRKQATTDSRVNSLDDVLREFSECCLNAPGRWSGLDLAGEFDRISATDTFTALYSKYALSTSIPPYESLLNEPELDIVLGVTRLWTNNGNNFEAR